MTGSIGMTASSIPIVAGRPILDSDIAANEGVIVLNRGRGRVDPAVALRHE